MTTYYDNRIQMSLPLQSEPFLNGLKTLLEPAARPAKDLVTKLNLVHISSKLKDQKKW